MRGKWRRRQAVFFLFASFALVALGVSAISYWMIKKPPEKTAREVVKHFSFSTAESLDVLKNKLLGGGRTTYSVTEENGKKCVRADSEGSASILVYEKDLSFEQNPFVSWDWKADKFPSRRQKEVLNDKEEFDFVAQFYVIFSSRFFLNAKAIQYVWTENVPVGTVDRSPYTKNVKIMVLESGPSESWKHEERNISEDFRNLFGEELEKDVAAIAFMTDSDSTGTSAAAYFDDITLGYLGAREKPRKTEEKKKKKLKRSKRFPFLREE